jgi:oleandomycin transport system ATP-binding protein
LLGPNGAGKTTTIRVLATLAELDAGRATVGGFDVVREPHSVRSLIGLAGQYAAVDEMISGRENLYMIGRLLGAAKAEAKARADELLEAFDLSEAATKATKTYSGGMRRRLDLAASLVGRPRFLYLDEPTTGLDPRSRTQLWELIQGLVAQGTTVLLTTQYLDEADRLSDRIVVIDRGKVIAEGTSDELKAQVGGLVLEVHPERADCDLAAQVLSKFADPPTSLRKEEDFVSASVAHPSVLGPVVLALEQAGVSIEDLALRRPSLDEVFLTLTGHTAEAEPEPEDAPREKSLA